MTSSHAADLWEGKPAAWWQSLWRLPALEIHERLPSTNDRARARAADGAPAGTLILAEHQTAGRGRLGRVWHAPPGSSLLMSFVLRPAQEEGSAPGTAPLRVGMAVADAIERAAGVRCAIKWPNDLVVPGRGKIAGVLCEATSSGDERLNIVAGVGVNVSQRREEWPADIARLATSVEECAGRACPRDLLMAAVVEAMRPLFSAPLLPLSPAELTAWAERDALRDRDVLLDREETPVTARGIAPDGALLVEGTDHVLRRITTATVRPVHHPAVRPASGAAT